MINLNWIIFTNLTLVLITAFYLYKVSLRTRGRLHKAVFYIFLAMILFGFGLFSSTLISSKNFDLYSIRISLSETVFLILLMIGFWNLQRCIREVDGEIIDHKSRIKKK